MKPSSILNWIVLAMILVGLLVLAIFVFISPVWPAGFVPIGIFLALVSIVLHEMGL